MIRPSRGAFVEEADSTPAESTVASADAAALSSSASAAAPSSLSPVSRPYCCLTQSAPSPRFLVVGLGNPGFPFTGTRHNIGRDLICAWQDSWTEGAAAAGHSAQAAGHDEERRPLVRKSAGSYKGPSRKGKQAMPDEDSSAPLPPHVERLCASRVASVDAYRMFDLSQSMHAASAASLPPMPGARQKAEAFAALQDPRTPGCTQPNCRCTIGSAATDAAALSDDSSSSSPAPAAAHASLCRCRVLISTPDLFMNLSGRAVSALSLQYRIPSRRIVIVYDDVSLPLGSMRIADHGSAGGHNGMADIIKCVGGEKKAEGIIRIRIGIGPRANSEAQRAAAQREQEEAAAAAAASKKGKNRARTHAVPVLSAARGVNLATYVLQRFTAEDLELLSSVRQWAAQAVMQIVTPAPDRRAQSTAAATAAAGSSDASLAVPLPPSCACLHASDSSSALARRVQLAMTRFNGQRAKAADDD